MQYADYNYPRVVAECDALRARVEELEAELARRSNLVVLLCDQRCGELLVGYADGDVRAAAQAAGWELAGGHLCPRCRAGVPL